MRFLTLFLYQLRGRWMQILGWGGSLFILAAYLISLHDAFVSQQEQYLGMISAYPPELMAAFGGTADLFTPSGFLNFTYFSYATVILGFLAISMGGGLLSSDEERGKLEISAAYPVSRTVLLAARLSAAVFALVAILALSWLGFAVTLRGTGLEPLGAGKIMLPHLELLVFLLFFAGLALLLSQLLPARSAATGLAGALLLAGYVLKTMLELDDKLAGLERFSPLHYLRGGYAIDGLKAEWVLGLLGCALLFILLSGWRFVERDLRVSGEGSWPVWIKKNIR
jgi:ABC-2 type transport system permease protein